MARVPSYSPTAIAELAFSYAHQLSRRSLHFGYKAHKKDFTVDDFGFAKELRSSTVLIMGTGKIGYESAKMFKSFGAKVLGYDLMPNKALTDVIEYVSLDEGLKQADIVTLHMPYIKGQNDKLVNAELLSKMKDGAILVNTSRGQIQDEKAILDAVKSGKLAGACYWCFQQRKSILI
nr:NAD(P)-dependent oxidoreductase [Mycoplasmopsis bovis]